MIFTEVNGSIILELSFTSFRQLFWHTLSTLKYQIKASPDKHVLKHRLVCAIFVQVLLKRTFSYFVDHMWLPYGFWEFVLISLPNVTVYFSLFSKLTFTLRTKIMAFGHDVNISVRCLQVLVQAIDAK